MGDNSVSRGLTRKTVDKIIAEHPDTTVEYLDLGADPFDHITGPYYMGMVGTPVDDEALKRALDEGSALVDQFLAADIVVLGAPMYNFNVPSNLKTWIDRLAIPGRTFRYTGPGVAEGLAGPKRVIVVSARAGNYSPESPVAHFDHQEQYLSIMFAFFGIFDLTFVRAEGLAFGEAERAEAIRQAEETIAGLDLTA